MLHAWLAVVRPQIMKNCLLYKPSSLRKGLLCVWGYDFLLDFEHFYYKVVLEQQLQDELELPPRPGSRQRLSCDRQSPGLKLLFIFLSSLKDILGCVQIFLPLKCQD